MKGRPQAGPSFEFIGAPSKHHSACCDDDVTAVSLTVDGTSVPVSLRNNIAFAEFPADARHASITISRADESENSETINLAG